MHRVLVLLLLGVLCACISTSRRIHDELGVAIDHRSGGRPALVFLHGFACDRSHWKNQLREFSPAHEVVAIDLAGHGDTTVEKEPWTVLGLADEIVAIVEALDLDEVVLVGHSMGGTVALAAAPRLGERVVGVVGVETLHNAELEVAPEERREMARLLREDFMGTMEGYLTEMYREHPRKRTLVRVISASLRHVRPEVAAALAESIADLDYPELLGQAGVPIRCLNARSPWVTEIEINQKYADYEAQIIDGVRHFPMLEKPEVFNRRLTATLGELAPE